MGWPKVESETETFRCPLCVDQLGHQTIAGACGFEEPKRARYRRSIFLSLLHKSYGSDSERRCVRLQIARFKDRFRATRHIRTTVGVPIASSLERVGISVYSGKKKSFTDNGQGSA